MDRIQEGSLMIGKRKRWIIVLLIGLLGVAGAAWAKFGGNGVGGNGDAAPKKDPAPREKPAVAVTVEPVTPRPIQRGVGVVGTLFGQEEVVLSAKVDGRIVKIHHDVGDSVRPGTPLLELDP